jgi:hypothetical protein
MQQQERGGEYPKKSQRFLDPVRVRRAGIASRVKPEAVIFLLDREVGGPMKALP